MVRPNMSVLLLVVGLFAAFSAQAQDRIASVGDSSPETVELAAAGATSKLVEIVRALDKATHTSTKIVLHPFARSIKETAAGHADFHIPLIQNGDSPAPAGLAFVTEVDFGQAQFVIYSRKLAPLSAKTVAEGKNIETEAGHGSLFPFPVNETTCVPCSLDKVIHGRIDALIVSSEIVDPLLDNANYKGIHRALYKSYPIRALVPVNADSAATRHYLIEGVKHLKKSGELWKIIPSNIPYSDWQP